MIARGLKLLRSDSVQATAWLAAGGAGFALANLVLAGVLAPDNFGRLVLVEALGSVGIGLAPLGMDNVAVRRELPARWESVGWVAATGAGVGTLFGVAAAAWYSLPLLAAALLATMCVAGGVATLCASFERARVRVRRAMLITQLPHAAFALGALTMRGAHTSDWRLGAAVLAGGHVLSALLGLRSFRRVMAASDLRSRPWSAAERREGWRTALTFVGIAASVYLLFQLERLLLPRLLTLTALASFSVVATVVASPYKMLANGMGYALMPKLRIAADHRERLRLIRSELVLAASLGIGGGAVLVGTVGPLLRLLYGAKYPVSPALPVAIAAAGMVTLLYAAVSSALYALASGRQLARFNQLGWAATGTAVLGAVLLSRFGVVGVVIGSSLGWVVRLVGAKVLLGPALRSGTAAEHGAGA